MINLILTNSLDNSCILQAVKNDYVLGAKQMVLVPDRFTLSYEKSILDFLNIKGSFDIEVASFSRLANKNLHDKTKLIDTQTEIMLLRKIIEDNKSQLLSFKNSSASVGFAKELGAVISQIRNSGVSSEKLMTAAEKMPIKLANKTRDIALIYSKYVNALTYDMSDGTSKLEALVRHLPQMGLDSYNIYIAEFLSLSKIEINVVEKLVECCKNITIIIVDGNGTNSRIFPKSLVTKLESIAQKHGLLIKKEIKNTTFLPQFSALADNLFGYNVPSKVTNSGNVYLNCANGIRQELKETAKKILDDINNGMRYKDIAVVCCDSESYLPILCEVFDKFDIPYFADNKQKLSNLAISQLMFSFLKVIESKFKRVEVVKFCKQILLEFDFEEVCMFENYCLKYGIDYTRFLNNFDIGKDDELIVAEKIRILMRKCFEGVNFKCFNANGYIKNILKFFENINIIKKIENFGEILLQRGEETFAKAHGQSFNKITEILMQFDTMLGMCQMEIEGFSNILNACIGSVEISIAPIFVDSVFVGEMSQSRFENIKAMYIVGASEGMFPTQHSNIGIVGERENSAWSAEGIIVEPNAKQMNYTEKLKLLLLLLKASEKLSISCSLTSGVGTKLEMSATMINISEILSVKPQSYPEPNDSWNLNDYFNFYRGEKFALENLFDLSLRLKQNLLLSSEENQHTMDLLYYYACKQKGQGYVDGILNFGGKEESMSKKFDFIWQNGVTSPSQLEQYFNCPFKHYIDYILKARRREKSDLEMSDMGTVLHEVAQMYFESKDCCELDYIAIIERVKEIYRQIVKTNVKLQIVAKRQNGIKIITELFDRSCKMLVNLVKKMQVTKFRPLPSMLEKKFGFGGENDLPSVELIIKNKVVNVRGIIDRIDFFEDRFLIFDYKSKASINFEPTNIVFGERCQLFIYLSAMLNSNITPAGLYYVLMSDKMKKEEEKENLYKYIGYSNVDKDNMIVFDDTLTENVKCESALYPIKIKVNKEGSKIDDKNVLLKDDMINLAHYTKKLCQKAVQEIDEGYIKASPIVFEKKDNTLCSYCEYKKMCGIDICSANQRIAKSIDIEKLKQIGSQSAENFSESELAKNETLINKFN